MNKNQEELLKRREYFNKYLPKLLDGKGCGLRKLGNTCPGCGFPTLDERHCWEICSICFWEDDGQDDEDADKVYGGPNGSDSLTKYRIEWDEILSNMKMEDDEIGMNFRKVDELMKNDDKSDIKEILALVDIISKYFDKKRRTGK